MGGGEPLADLWNEQEEGNTRVRMKSLGKQQRLTSYLKSLVTNGVVMVTIITNKYDVNVKQAVKKKQSDDVTKPKAQNNLDSLEQK